MNTKSIKSTSDQSLLVHYLTIRKSVGILGIILPFVLVFGVRWLTNCNILQNSISDYYYTKMGHYMTGTLCAVALFMFTYKGYDKIDLWSAKLAALFALGVAFFPTDNFEPLSSCKVLALDGNHIINIVHFTSATLLFLTFAFFSLFLFTKTSGNMTDRKEARNIIYKICGYLILLSIVAIFVFSIIPSINEQFRKFKPIFWFETLALLAFGLSWLTKGEGLLPDKEDAK